MFYVLSKYGKFKYFTQICRLKVVIIQFKYFECTNLFNKSPNQFDRSSTEFRIIDRLSIMAPVHRKIKYFEICKSQGVN